MTVIDQIKLYISGLPEPKRSEMQSLHELILLTFPDCKLWFLDGKNNEGKIIANPNIGYGHYTIKYSNGTTKDFFQIGLSANQTGISVYIMGLKDKKHLSETYGERIGKASISGYCIKFKRLADINIDILRSAIVYGFETTKV